MNTTSRAILLTVLSTDTSLSISENQAIQSLISGRVPAVTLRNEHPGRLLVTQKAAAALLSVSRVTIWRLKRDRLIRSVEVLPGTWRYSYEEIASIAQGKLTSPAE